MFDSIRRLARPSCIALIGCLAALVGTTEAHADGDAYSANVKPSLRVLRASSPIVLDGDLSEQAWKDATPATNFSETNPGSRVAPPYPTEAWFTYDDKNFYFAFKAHDDPRTLRAALSDHDSGFDGDYAGIILDTYGDAAWAYELFITPAGVMSDLLWTVDNETTSFDLVWSAQSKIVEDGWIVEASVPFASLRFPARDEQAWKIDVWRTRPRGTRETSSWSVIDNNVSCFPCQFGTLTGITGVKPAAGLELLPYGLVSQSATRAPQSGGTAGLHNDDPMLDSGVSAKYRVASNITAEATVNPDFSQVESDAAQIDVNSTFALFYDEKRPFFQEGSDLFSTWINDVYTRSINDPSVAWRVTGRKDRTSVAYIGARDAKSPVILPFEERSAFLLAGPSYSNIARVKHTFGGSSAIGALVTDRRFVRGGFGSDGGSNTTGGADLTWNFLPQLRFEGQYLLSHTEEPPYDSLYSAENPIRQTTFDRGRHTARFDGERFDGHALYASLEHDSQMWQFDVDYWETSPAFRADNGFVTQNDNKRVSLWTGLDFRQPHIPGVTFAQVSWFGSKVWNFDNVRKDEFMQPRLRFNTVGQTSVNLWYLWSHERFRDIDLPGIRRGRVSIDSNFSQLLSGGVGYQGGLFVARGLQTPELGDGDVLDVYATLKPVSRLVLDPSYSWQRLRHRDSGETIFRGGVFRTRAQYQFSHELFARVIAQYDGFRHGWEVDPLVSYKINPFTIAYIGSTHSFEREADAGMAPGSDAGMRYVATNRQIFAKFQYLFHS